MQDACGRFALGSDGSIVHPFAFTSRSNDPGAAKIRKMARDLRLAYAKDFDDVADANLPVGDEVQ